MKRVLLFAASMACASQVMAVDLVYNQLEIPEAVSSQLDCPHTPLMLDSVYIGANVGYDSYRIGHSLLVVGDEGTEGWLRQVSNAPGPLVGLLAGYGRAYNWLYIAGELYADSSGASETYHLNEYQSAVRMRYSLGASILPGILFNHAGLIYLRLGYVRSLFAVNEKGLAVGSDGFTQFENGLQAGIGIETELNYHLHLRTEVSQIQYGSFSSPHDTKFDPSDTQVSMSLLYHFDIM